MTQVKPDTERQEATLRRQDGAERTRKETVSGQPARKLSQKYKGKKPWLQRQDGESPEGDRAPAAHEEI